MEASSNEEAVLQQLNRLYIGMRKKYLQQYDSGDYAEVKRTLTDKQVLAHLRGKQTIGIFYCGQSSKFFSFDVDTLDWMTVCGLVNALQNAGIPSEAIHTEFSGLKGYHVAMFFDHPLPIGRLASFGRAILRKVNADAKTIEIRPESVNGRGIKLPFAVHRKSGNRSCFVDSFSLQPYDDQTAYVLGIRPFSADRMNDIITEAIRQPLEREPPRPIEVVLEEARRLFRDIRPPVVENSLSDRAQRLLSEGLRDGEGRHASQFYVILFLKQQGWTQEEVTERVIEWAMRERKRGRVESYEKHIRRDITKNVKQAFDGDMELYDTHPFTAHDVDLAFAASFKRTTVKQTVWSLIILSRIFADTDGQFYAARRMIEEMTGLSPTTVVKNLAQLANDGVLEKTKEGDYKTRKAAQYRLHGLTCVNQDGRTFQCSNYRDLFNQTFELVQEWRGHSVLAL